MRRIHLDPELRGDDSECDWERLNDELGSDACEPGDEWDYYQQDYDDDVDDEI